MMRFFYSRTSTFLKGWYVKYMSHRSFAQVNCLNKSMRAVGKVQLLETLEEVYNCFFFFLFLVLTSGNGIQISNLSNAQTGLNYIVSIQHANLIQLKMFRIPKICLQINRGNSSVWSQYTNQSSEGHSKGQSQSEFLNFILARKASKGLLSENQRRKKRCAA